MFHPEYVKTHIVQKMWEIRELAEKMMRSKRVYFDSETSGLSVRALGKDYLVGLTIMCDEDEDREDGKPNVYYIPFAHDFEGVYTHRELPFDKKDYPEFNESILDGEYYNMDKESVLAILRPAFELTPAMLVAHNLGFDLHVLANDGFDVPKMLGYMIPLNQPVTKYFDTMVSGHTINENMEKKLEKVIERRYGIVKCDYNIVVATVTNEEKKSIGMKSNQKASFNHVQIPIGGMYSGEDVFFLASIYAEHVQELVEDEQDELFYCLRMPFLQVLWNMERRGVRIDKVRLAEMTKKAELELERLRCEIYEIVGAEFNIGSDQQLYEILYGFKKKIKDKTTGGYKESYNKNLVDLNFGFKPYSWTAGGKDKDKTLQAPQTNADALADILNKTYKTERQKEGVEAVKLIVSYVRLSTLYGTFMVGLADNIYADGKVHPSFNICGTDSWRLSCDSPNLQQLPRPLEGDEDDYAFWIQFEIRSLIIPDNDDECIIAADYSALEKRITAHVTEDVNLLKMIREGHDPHGFVATLIFEECSALTPKEVKKVYPHLRQIAKTVGFAIDYGGTEFTVAKNLGIEKEVARSYIDKYFEGFYGLKSWMETQKMFARKYGFVSTVLGHKRHLPDINSSNMRIKSYNERVALNAPTQGSAADVTSRGEVKLELNTLLRLLGTRQVLQVHDEVVFIAKKKYRFLSMELIGQDMCHPLPQELILPLAIGIDHGQTYAEAK